jgi:putative tryptophan/tyrosine transport system substrate-binding protein
MRHGRGAGEAAAPVARERGCPSLSQSSVTRRMTSCPTCESRHSGLRGTAYTGGVRWLVTVLSRRRFLVAGLGLAGVGLLSGCATLPIGPPRQARLPRVGYLDSNSQERVDGFRQGLADHGYVEGRNIIVEWRDSEGRAERLPGLAAELVGLPVDVLVASGNSATWPLKAATTTIPIVMAMSFGPVEDGLVASLARPGGNITGLTHIGRELVGKRMELLKAVVPRLSRVGVIWNPARTDRDGEFQLVEAAAGALGLELRSLEVRDPGALEAAFERAAAERVDGLFVISSPVLQSSAPRVGELARRHRLPMMSGQPEPVAAGGLMTYSPNYPAMFRRAAGYVDRILKGADPAELPIEQPTRFELVINLKTARELGLTIPPLVLQQATEVIQ